MGASDERKDAMMDIEDAKKAIANKAKLIASDIEHALNGNFDQISIESQASLANMINNEMQGISRFELPINDRVTLGYVERSSGGGMGGGGGKYREVYIRMAIPSFDDDP